MDQKTKQLVERCERNHIVDSTRSGIMPQLFIDVIDLCLAVKEQDKRARHAEQERDAFGERIAELEAEVAQLKSEDLTVIPTVAKIREQLTSDSDPAEAVHAYLVWRCAPVVSRLRARIERLDAQLKERTEAASAWDALAVARLKTINDLSTRLDIAEGRVRLLLLDRVDVIKVLAPYSKSEDSAVGSARDAATKLDYASKLARLTIQQRALITDEMKALAVSVIG